MTNIFSLASRTGQHSQSNGEQSSPGSLVIELSEPVSREEGALSSITLRPVRYGELLALGDVDEAVLDFDATGQPSAVRIVANRSQILSWLERLSGQSADTICALSVADGRKLETALRVMLGAARLNVAP
jgi:hypothetical protein